MEMVLSRDVSNRRIFPALDINKSGTRKAELLMEPQELEWSNKIRRVLATMGTVEAAKALVDQLAKYPTNRELLEAIRRQAESGRA